MTTALFNALVDTMLDALAGVRNILFGGEAASTEHVARAFRALGPGRLIHVYGPTETTVFATAQAILELDEAARRACRSAARSRTPRSTCWTSAADPCRRAWWASCTSAATASRCGYLNRDELTAERFVADPFRHGRRCIAAAIW